MEEKSGKIRVFTAVDVSEEVREKTAAYISKLRQLYWKIPVGWEKPEKLHLTLKFLGDIDAAQLEKLKNVVEAAASNTEQLSLTIENTGVFPPRSCPRVLWLGVTEENLGLTKLQDLMEKEAEKAGFEREKRAYHPHLTIARLRVPAKSRELAQYHLQVGFPPINFEVNEVTIYKSEFVSGGSVYKVISKYKLKGE
jgi:2'-5' RNA ligase